jgi:hypothetical protein
MRYIASWLLFIAGDLVSRLLHRMDWTAPVLYPLYNLLIFKSSDIQGNGPGPWRKP